MDTTSARSLALAAAGGSGLLLIAALGFQAAGYAPCGLCLLQRWPHYAAVVIGAIILLTGYRPAWAVLGMIAAAVATGLALYHTGVELRWWAGPTACSGAVGNISAMSPAELMDRISTTRVIRCDQPAWSFLGLSMAAWNGLFSAALTVVWAMSIKASRR